MKLFESNPEVSVVVAVYNEDPRNLIFLLERLTKAMASIDTSYEVVFVNDGSRAPTSSALRHLAAEGRNIKLIELSRNFGQQAAISAGMDHADGQAIINLDSDLQDPPELIPEMVRHWRLGYDVVFAQRSTRRDRLAKRVSAFLFYRILGSISSVRIPWDTGDFRLLDRRVKDALQLLPEKTKFLRGLIPWLGFKQIGIPIDRDAREVGESTYTLRKLISLATDGLVSFSLAPLYLILFLGMFFVIGSVVAIFVFALSPMSAIKINQTVLISILALIAGFETVSLGIVAIYLGKVLDEVRARPPYIVADRKGHGFVHELVKSKTMSDEAQTVSASELSQTHK
jgi:glycosyltransferase involved in cell wall biosynthesis